MNKREKSIRISVAAMGIGQSTNDQMNYQHSKDELKDSSQNSELRSYRYVAGMDKKNLEDVDIFAL